MVKKNLKTKKTSTETQRLIFERVAEEFARESERWSLFFGFAKSKGLEPCKVISFIYSFQTGKDLSESEFVFARVSKLFATTEKQNVNENLVTKKDLVNWNRQAVLAMIEAEKQGGASEEKIERGYKTIELINALFPEFLIEPKKSSPFPRW